tara:strand:- start:952 stop:1383 length:432 start_codon:yes stop_codon:yes gene_type:complete
MEDRPWLLQKVVLPQHTDHAGVMWHGAYLSWLEESRIQALSNVGLEYSNLSKDGYELPVISLSIDYKMALLHGDKVNLKSWALQAKGVRWSWKTIFYKDADKEVARSTVDLVLIRKSPNSSQVLRKPPIQIAKAMKELQIGPK